MKHSEATSVPAHVHEWREFHRGPILCCFCKKCPARVYFHGYEPVSEHYADKRFEASLR